MLISLQRHQPVIGTVNHWSLAEMRAWKLLERDEASSGFFIGLKPSPARCNRIGLELVIWRCVGLVDKLEERYGLVL